MNETLATERQLFRAYEIVFEALLNGLVIAVVVLLLAAIVLIILCCRELQTVTKRRDAEMKAAYEASLGTSDNEGAPRRNDSFAELRSVRPEQIASRAVRESVENATEKRFLTMCRKSLFRRFGFNSQNQRNPQ